MTTQRIETDEERKIRQRKFFNGLANLLTDEEKEVMGRYWDAEERMKEKRVDYMNKLLKEELEKTERRYA